MNAMNGSQAKEKVRILTDFKTRITIEGENAGNIADVLQRYMRADVPAVDEITAEDLEFARESLGLNKKEMSEYYGLTSQNYGFKEMPDGRSPINRRDAIICRWILAFGLPDKLK